jgi:hypothetical protein
MLRMEGRAPRKCPLYPQKRTFSEAAQMSAKCHKRTWAYISPKWMASLGGSHANAATSIEAHQPDSLSKLGTVSGEQTSFEYP